MGNRRDPPTTESWLIFHAQKSRLSDEFVLFVQSLRIDNPLLMQFLLSVSASFITEFTPNDAAASMLLPVVITVVKFLLSTL